MLVVFFIGALFYGVAGDYASRFGFGSGGGFAGEYGVRTACIPCFAAKFCDSG
jgi:hypothetical protein